MLEDGPVVAELAAERDGLRELGDREPELEREVAELRRRVVAIEGSLWWRLTAPLRFARYVMLSRRSLALRFAQRIRARLEP